MRITFFPTRKPKSFNYIPRYYDEEKEEREKRQKRIESELGKKQDKDHYQSSIHRGVMSRKLSERRKANRGAVIRLLVIATILFLLAYYFITGGVPSSIFNFFIK